MKWFDQFCRVHNLRYYLIGGTMLGAVRHKGFIPWDDDIDIGMPRCDYERFFLLTLRIDDCKYVVESFRNEKPDFMYPYIKIYDTSTTLIENNRYKTTRGIYIDLFPLDGIGNTEAESRKNFSKIYWKNNMLYAQMCALSPRRSFYKNAAIIIARCIPSLICSGRKLLERIDNECRSRGYEEYDYIGNLLGNWRYREVMRKSIFGVPVEYKFEGCTVYGVENFDMYLSTVYGNYLELPPLEKRKTHHDYLHIELNKPYSIENNTVCKV
jgi:lipopolysaccharide cholinephosphotransferase